MSLIDISQPRGVRAELGPSPAATADGGGGPPGAEHGATAVAYLLVHNSPDQPTGHHRTGWTLIARHDQLWDWSTELAAHGAGTHARPRAAQAVAVRVLAGHGVTVEGWSDEPADQAGDPPVCRARVTHPRAPSVSAPGWRLVDLWAAVSHQLRGH